MLDGMIDSHCHLDHCDDPEGVADPTLSALITVGTTAERNIAAIGLAERLPNVFAAVGIHPNNASDADHPEVRAAVEAHLVHPRVVAVGETGFDTHWESETLTAQSHAYVWQAELAAAHDLPLILHVRDRQGRRDASQAAAEHMIASGHSRGVLHCFNGDPELLQVGLELGWMVSFAGNLTYRSATALHEAARIVPDDRVMVETDSPFLTPIPHRGRRNRPAYVRHTAAFLTELREDDPERFEAQLDANANAFYRLP
jgi:TatD DNase family protein